MFGESSGKRGSRVRELVERPRVREPIRRRGWRGCVRVANGGLWDGEWGKGEIGERWSVGGE
jgi:hypothetical protein